MSFSDYAERKILDAFLRNTAPSIGTTIALGLHTADPLDAGTGTEVSGGSYARKALSTTTDFNAAAGSSGSVSNNNNLTWPTATANWGTITHIALWDNTTGGNCLWSGALSASKTVGSGDTFQIDAGNLTFTVD